MGSHLHRPKLRRWRENQRKETNAEAMNTHCTAYLTAATSMSFFRLASALSADSGKTPEPNGCLSHCVLASSLSGLVSWIRRDQAQGCGCAVLSRPAVVAPITAPSAISLHAAAMFQR